MAKAQHIKHSSNFSFPQGEKEALGDPVKELKKRDFSKLSNALLRRGESRLLQGDRSGIEFFEMALKLDPANTHLLVSQGIALFEYGSIDGNEEGLSLASKRFKAATTLAPHSFEAWHLWGNTLYLLGIRKKEPSYFFNALKKYEKAFTLREDASSEALADLHWDAADLWSKLANISGEIDDYHKAIQNYDKAIALEGEVPAEFWMNYSNVYLVLGEKTNDLRFFIKSINGFKSAISTNISSYEGWFKLATALKALYSYTQDEDHFEQANECYATALQLSGNQKEIYLEWARLLLDAGSTFRDLKKLRSCIEKCQQAHLKDSNNPYIIGVWAEAYAYLGAYTDKLELLNNAQNLLTPFVEKLDDPEILYSQGVILSALGLYYKDSDYYYQAIESCQEGLTINRSHHKLWYAMASSAFAAATLDNDDKNYERACHFFKQALNLKASSTYHCHYAMCLSKYGDLLQDQETLELSLYHFEQALEQQKNAAYLHPDWIFHFAVTLDHVAGFLESERYYIKALDLLNHILMLKPEFPRIHYQLAIVHSHHAELINEPDLYHRAIHHFRIAYQQEKENDQIILDWSLTLVNLGDLLENHLESDHYFREAEYKMIQAAKLGNIHAYYSLACLYSLIGDVSNSLRFLEKAKAYDVLPTADELSEDDWLENVRETEGFQTLLSEIESPLED